jgi:hypothetical protein
MGSGCAKERVNRVNMVEVFCILYKNRMKSVEIVLRGRRG